MGSEVLHLSTKCRVEGCRYNGRPCVRLYKTIARTQKVVSLSLRSWVNMLHISDCVNADISAIKNNIKFVDGLYHLGSGVHIHVKTPFRIVYIKTWVRRERQCFRATISAFKLTCSEWDGLMKASSRIREALPETVSTPVCYGSVDQVDMCDGFFQEKIVMD